MTAHPDPAAGPPPAAVPGGAAEPAAAPDPVRLSEARGRWVLAAAILGSAMALLDATVVNVALPAIGKGLDASLAGLQWTVNGYTLTLAALILLGGALGDRLGRKRVFMIGVAWFAVASVLCGLAPTTEVLVAARALQGVGGALLTPGSLALLQASFHPEDRARAIGAWSGLGGVAAAVGPLLGGWLVDAASWRWIFLLNAPVAAAVLLATARHVPESRSPARAGRFDVAGAALAAVALGATTYALIGAADRGLAADVVAAAAAGLLTAVAFVLVERRVAAPMVPAGLFANPRFAAINVVTLFVYAALSGVLFFVVVALQTVAGWDALAAGVALWPVTVLLLLLSSRVGGLASRVGLRWFLTAGPVVAAVGVLLLTRVDRSTSYLVDVLPGAVLFGLGLALLVAPLTAGVLAAAADRYAGIASGVNNAVARAAGLLAVAALPLVVGLSGDDYADPAAMRSGMRGAMVACAVLLALGGAFAWWSLRLPADGRGSSAAEPGPAA